MLPLDFIFAGQETNSVDFSIFWFIHQVAWQLANPFNQILRCCFFVTSQDILHN